MEEKHAEQKRRLVNGAELIVAERLRQVEAEGWTPEHDDEHEDGELALAAASYVLPEDTHDYSGDRRLRPYLWPWADTDFKSGERIRELEKAGALIAAEIDRLLRAEGVRADG